MKSSALGARMKEYEHVPKQLLLRRTPVIIRLDGRAFHTFTKRRVIKESQTNDPFSDIMHHCMDQTMIELCKQIQNVRIGYTQSDEISLLLTDWATHDTQQWFNGNTQKIVSLSASIATNAFNRYYGSFECISNIDQMPTFDARAFNLPKEEVANYFIWRQHDATRNSMNMLSQHHFSHRELQGKKNSEMHDMLMLQRSINWNDIDVWKKRGTCAIKRTSMKIHPSWIIDENIPIFTQNRDYIEGLMNETES
jgi:tRNA(His) 5'-end guanylyltransferase